MTGNLESAFAPFRASLLSGGFAPPDDGGWSAEIVAAHIALNNDEIADVAEAVVRGEEVRYDNEGSIDEVALTRYADGVGGLVGLAQEIQRSAARLENAYGLLGDRAETEIHVRIRDGNDIAYDGPMAIGQFMVGNATRHLELHHDQLKALHGPWLGEPPDKFDAFQLILLCRAPNPPLLDDATSEALQKEHLGHFAKMRHAGYLALAGPIVGDPEIAGICVYRASSVEEARLLAEDDPAVRAGRFEVQAMNWYTAKGAITQA